MSLRTYAFDTKQDFLDGRPWPIDPARGRDEPPVPPMGRFAPGDCVVHSNGSGYGMVVALRGDDLSVLWSDVPDEVQPEVLQYNPLAVDEDIYVPIRKDKPVHAPPSPEQNALDISYVARALRRMVRRVVG